MRRYIALFSFLLICLIFWGNFVHDRLSEYEKSFNAAKEETETMIDEEIVPKYHLKNLYGLVMPLTGRRLVNDTILLNDGHWLRGYDYNSRYDEAAESIINIRDYLSGDGIPFLFIRVPDQIEGNNEVPWDVEERTIEFADKFTEELNKNDIDVLDLRIKMAEENINFKDAFYLSDHHWKTETAFWALGKAGEHINESYNVTLDPYYWDKNNYEFVTFKDTFEGSLTERIGSLATGKDDFTAILPKFDTEFKVAKYYSDRKMSGSFEDVFTPFVNEKNPEENAKYTSIAYSVRGYDAGKIVNSKVEDDQSILVVSDSYGHPFITYLAPAVNNVDFLYIDGGGGV